MNNVGIPKKLRKRLRIRRSFGMWLEDAIDEIRFRFGALLCKAFGHRKPYEQKLKADLCTRCHKIVNYYSSRTPC